MSSKVINKEDVVGIEPKHITYVKAQDGSDHDLLLVKEAVHLKDGSIQNKIRPWVDYKRPFWVTLPGQRNHEEKRDYEYARNLQKYSCTQIELPRRAAKALNDFSSGPNPPLRRLARSPYLYGADISSTALLKSDYREKYPGLFSRNKVAAGDIETNVFSADEEIICMSVTHRGNASLFYLKRWIADIENPIEQTHAKAQEFIGDTLRERNITLEVVVCDTPAEIVQEAMKRLHAWQTDFFTFWNMDFDISHMTADLERAGIDPADVFSDPIVPPRYRYFNYRKGQEMKETASGKTMSINIEDRWGWVTHPASFQIIDSLPVYRLLRVAKGKDSSYALDYILDKELGITKLKFEEASHATGLRWHEIMQERHKIEYGVYNIFDSISLELLDEKTNDLASNISLHSKNSDYKNFNSNPKRLCDDMHFWYLRRPDKCVIGTSSDDPVHELDKFVVGHEDWVVTLPSFMAAPNGLTCVEEMPDYKTLIFSHVADQLVV